MRLTKYVKSDGENWMMIKIRCSAHCSYDRLNKLMLDNGWVRWDDLKAKFDKIKKRLAATDPVKFPNWKQVVVPMIRGTKKDLPMLVQAENDAKNVEVLEPLLEDIPLEVPSDGKESSFGIIDAKTGFVIGIDPASETCEGSTVAVERHGYSAPTERQEPTIRSESSTPEDVSKDRNSSDAAPSQALQTARPKDVIIVDDVQSVGLAAFAKSLGAKHG